jgi:FdhD protein
MARGRTQTVLVTTLAAAPADPADSRRHPDELIVEEPMTIRLDDTVVATTMRTPGHDYELAVGFCLTEGLLCGAPVRTVRYCATGAAGDSGWNEVSVETGGLAPPPTPRLGNATSSCGWCGTAAVDVLVDRLSPLSPSAAIPAAVLHSIPSAVRDLQALFAATGAVHAAAAFGPEGDVRLVREDVGRHNAVDKVVGRMHLDGLLPATGLGLFVSGRASFELVQKAWSAGFGTLAAVSGPTALAVSTARRAGLTLVGFTSAERLNVYAPERPAP